MNQSKFEISWLEEFKSKYQRDQHKGVEMILEVINTSESFKNMRDHIQLIGDFWMEMMSEEVTVSQVLSSIKGIIRYILSEASILQDNNDKLRA